jgi:hypothetical protein
MASQTVAVVNPAHKRRKSSGGKKRKTSSKQRAAARRNIKKARSAKRRIAAQRSAAGRKGARARSRKRTSGKRRKTSRRSRVTTSVGRRQAKVIVRYSNPKKRRKSTSHRRRRTANPRRMHRRRRNPGKLSLAKFKGSLPMKGKWHLGDYICTIGGFGSTMAWGGVGPALTGGNQLAAPVSGGVWWLGTSYALNKIAFTRKYIARGYFWGGAVGFGFVVIGTIVNALTPKPQQQAMKGLAALEELAGLGPLDAAKELMTTGIGNIQKLLTGGGKLGDSPIAAEDLMSDYVEAPFATQLGWTTDVVGPGGGLSGVRERGWGRGDSSYDIKRMDALGSFSDEMTAWKKSMGIPSASEFADQITGM